MKLAKALRRFGKDDSGATALEYGLFAALIAAIIVTNVQGIGTAVNTGFETVKNAMADAGGDGDG